MFNIIRSNFNWVWVYNNDKVNSPLYYAPMPNTFSEFQSKILQIFFILNNYVIRFQFFLILQRAP